MIKNIAIFTVVVGLLAVAPMNAFAGTAKKHTATCAEKCKKGDKKCADACVKAAPKK